MEIRDETRNDIEYVTRQVLLDYEDDVIERSECGELIGDGHPYWVAYQLATKLGLEDLSDFPDPALLPEFED